MPPIRTDRRSFLLGLTLAGVGAWPIGQVRRYAGTQVRQVRGTRWAVSPFTLGIASGDPTPDGVVLWTRLAPDPLNGGGMTPEPVNVGWEIATDDSMRRVVRSGTSTATPEWAHSVHVEVDGLDDDRPYWYRFHSGDASSPIGRTRTIPKPGAGVDRLRFAFASCQHYESGWFTAYRHMSREDLDLIFHLGDYIYEGGGRENQTRKHQGPEIMTLADYRTRHAQYRLDPDLQAAHAVCPWVVTPDDHEVENNYAGAISERNDPRDQFLLRRGFAYKAYYEHMPLRRLSIPTGPDIRLYRQMPFGSLASFFVLDTRQYRTDQPCADGTKVPCEAVADPGATLLGADQERWLFDGMTRSRGRWNVLPQQVMIAKVDQFAGPEQRFSMDQWSGYDAARTRLMEFLDAHRSANPIVLTGDIHSSWVNDLRVDFQKPDGRTVGTEFVGTSITSGGDGSDMPARIPAILGENPFVKFHNSQRGYVSCLVTKDEWRADYKVVEFVTRPDAPIKTRASFVVRDGRPGAEQT